MEPLPGRQGQNTDGDEQGHDDRDCDGDREIREQLTLDFAHKDDGQENGHGCRCRGEQSTPNLFRTDLRRSFPIETALASADDVLHHHDGRIEHHAYGESEARQGNDVQ